MSDQLDVAFLWHMHQPSYRDPATGIATLPWVRLHAAKDYVDLVARLADFPTIHQTFNLTPCLLEQLAWYAAGHDDGWAALAARPTEDLSEPEQAVLAQQGTFAHPWRMIAPHPRYYELVAMLQRGQPLDLQELRDLTVWFHLVWLDPRWRRRDPALVELVNKGGGFTESDKALVLAKHRELLAQVVPTYRAAQARGQIEVTTSPYAHPILPLLVETAVAREATPGLPLPVPFSAPSDAAEQLRRASAVFEATWGRRPAGLWPSEGAVSDAILPLVAQAGFQWLATDEGILRKSLGGSPPRAALYQPYRWERDGQALALLFRDQLLSDLIGFTYAHQPAVQAADDLLRRLREIRRQAPGPAPVVAVILDGENAWEHYPDDGEEFLQRLYEGLSREPGLRCVTVSDYLQEHPAREPLARVAPGSWIRRDFTTWIGDEEKNRAWTLLVQARACYAQAADHPRAAEALDHLLIAEGSDWFWWFGPEHTSAHDAEFDRLFRQHLAQVYTILDRPVPSVLLAPIRRAAPVGPVPPARWFTPTVDGEISDYFEWLYAGRLDCAQARGAMAPGQDRLQRLWWGCDRTHWYLRLDLAEWPGDVPLAVTLVAEPPTFRLEVVVEPDGARAAWAVPEADGRWGPPKPLESLAVQRIVELAVPLAALGLRPGMAIRVQLQVAHGEPAIGPVTLTLPEETDVHTQWSA